MSLNHRTKNEKNDYISFEEDFCLCGAAFRYALGRMSAAPKIVTDYILTKLNRIPSFSINKMIEELNVREEQFGKKGFGMDFDYDLWMEFKQKLIQEIDRRKVSGEY